MSLQEADLSADQEDEKKRLQQLRHGIHYIISLKGWSWRARQLAGSGMGGMGARGECASQGGHIQGYMHALTSCTTVQLVGACTQFLGAV